MPHKRSIEGLPASGPIAAVRESVALRVTAVLGNLMETSGELAGGTVKAAGRGIRGFMHGLLHRNKQ